MNNSSFFQRNGYTVTNRIKWDYCWFSKFWINECFSYRGRGIFNVENTKSKTKDKLLVTLRGDIIITTPDKAWERVEKIVFHASNIFPGNREDFLFTTSKFDFEWGDEKGMKAYASQHMLHIKKDTWLEESELKKLNALKYKSVLGIDDKAFLGRIEMKRAAHKLKITEELHTFLNAWTKTASEIELF